MKSDLLISYYSVTVCYGRPSHECWCMSLDIAKTYTFSAKEKDSETGFSYFGSRYYSSDLSIWLSVDPMSDKYPSLSPYVYCADNPVKLVDPNGEQWESDEDERKAKSLITQAQGQLNTNNESIKKITSKETLSKRDKTTLTELIHQNEYLSEGIANLTDMGNSTEETFHFNNRTNIDEGCVQKRQDGVIDIIHSGDAMAWHETVHFGDYKKNINWNFDENGFLGTSPENYAASEYKAYESQFSFDNNSLKYSNGTIVQSISQVKKWVNFHGFDVK
jgi:RHS repeat-associated core domain